MKVPPAAWSSGADPERLIMQSLADAAENVVVDHFLVAAGYRSRLAAVVAPKPNDTYQLEGKTGPSGTALT